MNAKNTKRALLTSALALLLCVSMLIGSTFAWFTDSVTSTGNIIQSGTLDVEMSWSDSANGTYQDASQGAIFDYKLWEPGFTQIKFIKLENKGNLALQYKLSVIPSIIDESAEVDLADVIDVYTAIADSSFADPANIADVKASMMKLGTLSQLIANAQGADTGVLLPADGSSNVELPAGAEAYTGEVTVCLALHMQETAGNEYQNLSVGEGLSVQLLATQYTYENDTFNNQYDNESDYDLSEVRPIAKVTYRDDLVDTPTTSLNWNNKHSMVKAESGVVFDAAYQFSTPEDVTTEIAEASPYAYHLADFAISFDSDITAKNGVGMAGEYGEWGWIGFKANDEFLGQFGISKLEAGQYYDLLGSSGINVNYIELCENVKTLNCATWAENAAGVTMTVELRLYETYTEEECLEKFGYLSKNVKTGNYMVIGTYSYTFDNIPEPPVASVTYKSDVVDVPTTSLNWNGEYGMVDAQDGVVFDTAYTFTATETGAEAADSVFATYLADFAVSFDSDITTANGVGLAGEYGSWGWLGFLANDELFNKFGIEKLEAGETYNLLESYGINIDYENLCESVKNFNCAAWADNAAGTTMTVELRLYETYTEEECMELFGYKSVNVKTGNYVVVGVYEHTF